MNIAKPIRSSFWNSTRRRLITLVLLVVIPALIVQLIGAWSDLRQNISDRKQVVGNVAAHAQADFTNLVNESRMVLTDLVRVDGMRNPDNCLQVFTALRLAYERLAPEAVNISLSDVQGNIYCSVIPTPLESNIAAQPYFQSALQTNDLALGTYTLSNTGAPVFHITYPVFSAGGSLQSVIIATYQLHWLATWQSEMAWPSGTALTLVSPDGSILQRWLDGVIAADEISLQNKSWFMHLRDNPNQPGVIEARDLDGITRLNALIPLQTDAERGEPSIAAYLHLGYPVAELYTKVYRSLLWKLALLSITAAGGLLLAWWGSERLFLRPLNKMMGLVEQVQAGDLKVRVATAPDTYYGGLHELNQLALSFDRMTEALQQREAERQLSDARFRAMFETSAVGIGIMDLDRKIVDANPAMCQMFGRSLEEFTGQTPAIATYPEDYPRSTQEFEELLTGKRLYYFDERRYVRKNGEVFWAHVTMSTVRDASGAPLYMVGMVIDINEQRRTLDELQQSEARFRAMFDSAAVGVSVLTLDRRIVQINQTASRLTGYSPEEITNLNPSFLAIEEDRYIDREMFSELVEGKRDQYTVEKRYRRKDGTQFWGRVNFSAVRGSGGTPIYTIGIIEDITSEKLAAERLAAQEAENRRTLEQRIAERTTELNQANTLLQQKAAQEAVAAERTRLARDLHDAVTQTLFSATLISDVLPDLWEINPASAKLSLEELRQLTRGALAEMRTLLVELRPNALVEVPLAILLRQLAEAITGRARLQVQLNAEGERVLPPEVQISLYRIAQEALNNVVKHAKATQAVVTLRLGESVRLVVADNGSSFDPSAVTADHLGLKIMRERAGNIGAKFNISSEPEEGTQISVLWKSAEPPSLAEPTHPADPSHAKEC